VGLLVGEGSLPPHYVVRLVSGDKCASFREFQHLWCKKIPSARLFQILKFFILLGWEYRLAS